MGLAPLEKQNLTLLLGNFRPTDAESQLMLRDLEAIAGAYWAASALNARRKDFRAWKAGRKLSASRRALLWHVWAQVCRPGEVRTVFDMTTFGRFTRSGGPENAGKPFLRPLARRLKDDADGGSDG